MANVEAYTARIAFVAVGWGCAGSGGRYNTMSCSGWHGVNMSALSSAVLGFVRGKIPFCTFHAPQLLYVLLLA